MRALHLTWTELRRITANRTARLSVIALLLVPTIYAGLYLYANHDPYARLDQVPAALVVDDAGATSTDGIRLTAGREVADRLLESGDFDWHEVPAAEALEGVRDGAYDFALVLPRDFSRSLGSLGGVDPEQARLRLVTNDANSYLSTTIANTVVTTVRDAIAAEVGERAAMTFLVGFADVREGMLEAADGADRLGEGLGEARTGSRRLATGAGDLAAGARTLRTGAGKLATGLGTIEKRTATLPRDTRKLADGAREVADGNAELAGFGRRAKQATGALVAAVGTERRALVDTLRELGLDAAEQQQVLAVYDRATRGATRADERAAELSGQLDELSAGAGRVAAGNERLARAMPGLVAGIAKAGEGATGVEEGAGELAGGAGRLGRGASELNDGLGQLVRGTDRLETGLTDGASRLPRTTDESREQIADAISDPVDIRSASQAAASSYGAGLAPLFLALAAWIGGYVLFQMVRPLSRRALAANQAPWRIALGGWAAPALLGAVQMVAVVLVVTFAVDIRPAGVLATVAVMALASATFVALIHALCALLGRPGQFVALVLMVLQLISSGGTFPWQTIPAPLYPLHYVLPMGHAVDALRQVMYGAVSGRLVADVLVLLAWLVGSLALATLAARRQRVWTPKQVDPEFVM